ncbi:MAG TPA: HEAT repeat domain-containing protein [Gemmatimonadaceae bacterium]|nr:HEAT repeat domain-containing protein [Gemmatimonadaceae bacterium]
MLTSLILAVISVATPPAAVMSSTAPVASVVMQSGAADSVYRAARSAFNDDRYRRAVDLFGEYLDRFPRGGRAADALYYRAFSRFRLGERSDLRAALSDLSRYEDQYRSTEMIDDARALRTRVCSALAGSGDAECGQELVQRAGGPPPAGTGPRGSGPTGTPPAARGNTRSTSDDDDDLRIMALNGLIQMNSEAALPILKRLLADRSGSSENIREQALWLVSQKGSREAVDILLDVAKNDPSSSVRENAVFWLSQTNDPRVVDVLEQMLMQSTDRAIQQKAVFSLSQVRGQRASDILRAYAERKDAPEEVRADAIFWLAQSGRGVNVTYLRDLYGRLTEDELKDKVIFALTQMKEGRPVLLEIAKDTRENPERRGQAIFWLGQGSNNISELASLYGTLDNSELKEQVIFSISQSSDRAALDKLMEIARSDKDRSAREKAVFWIGQSRDPRAVKFIEELINR